MTTLTETKLADQCNNTHLDDIVAEVFHTNPGPEYMLCVNGPLDGRFVKIDPEFGGFKWQEDVPTSDGEGLVTFRHQYLRTQNTELAYDDTPAPVFFLFYRTVRWHVWTAKDMVRALTAGSK